MSHSKSHYYRSRLLRERVRTRPVTTELTNTDDGFSLPDYFNAQPPSGAFPDDDQGRYPRVVLWDEHVPLP
uniref:hypothetical protein n=1 Tax=Marinobacterium profundum TaxID=1714300 RepID=UPI000B213E17|nr:hypothetical protein [Marinobacterium profundum]